MIENFILRPDASVLLRETFPTGKRYYIPGGSSKGGKDGVIVTFATHSKHEWTGVFAFGTIGGMDKDAIIPLPKCDSVLIISRGAGYLIRESIPGEFEVARAIPVKSIHVVESCQLVILADDTSLVAYGKNGLIWETGRIAWSDLQVVSICEDNVLCTTFDIRSEEDINFTVDTLTGKCSGGISVL